MHDVVVIGLGPSGLACLVELAARGHTVVGIDAQQPAQTVRDMVPGKHIFAEPAAIKNASGLWLQECTREELLAHWEPMWTALPPHASLRLGARVVDVRGAVGDFTVLLDSGAAVRARRVVLASGKSGQPRKAGARGEDVHAARIRHRLSDPSAFNGQDIVIYGGGDVACEAALALMNTNRVTLATLDAAFTFPKKRNVDAILHAERAGTLQLRMGARLSEITADGVALVQGKGAAERVAASTVFEMIGADPPLGLFKKLGIALDGAWDARKYAVATLVFLGVYALYALKKFPETPYAWPFTLLLDQAAFARGVGAVFDVAFWPFHALFTPAASADIKAALWFQQGYLYSLAYTCVMAGFGYTALIRWTRIAQQSKGDGGRYQRWRYASLMAFQLAFFLIANVVAVQGLSVQFAWRAWGLYQPWPLFFNTYHWWETSDPIALKVLFIGGGLVGTLVAIPLLAWKNGKRFCTWVCGCGGLAETLGDRWRHLAPKGKRARAWEFQGYVVLLSALLVTLVSVGIYGTRADNAWAQAYSYIVDFWLVAVIPIAAYPFFGGKVWCRYWCPLAAWNQLLARLYGRLGIASNDACISCGQCSKQCQVGIDVMAFAKQQEKLDNTNSGCIQCGICIDVCPVDVLSFTTAPRARGALPIVS